jgi:hypothetical protein
MGGTYEKTLQSPVIGVFLQTGTRLRFRIAIAAKLDLITTSFARQEL